MSDKTVSVNLVLPLDVAEAVCLAAGRLRIDDYMGALAEFGPASRLMAVQSQMVLLMLRGELETAFRRAAAVESCATCRHVDTRGDCKPCSGCSVGGLGDVSAWQESRDNARSVNGQEGA